MHASHAHQTSAIPLTEKSFRGVQSAHLRPPLCCGLMRGSVCADPKLQDKAGTQAAVEYVSGLIQQEVAAGIPLDRIVVAGFSQVPCRPLRCCCACRVTSAAFST